MVKVLNNLGNVYTGAATGLRRDINANGLEAKEHRLRKVRNMNCWTIYVMPLRVMFLYIVQQHDLMRRRVMQWLDSSRIEWIVSTKSISNSSFLCLKKITALDVLL